MTTEAKRDESIENLRKAARRVFFEANNLQETKPGEESDYDYKERCKLLVADALMDQDKRWRERTARGVEKVIVLGLGQALEMATRCVDKQEIINLLSDHIQFLEDHYGFKLSEVRAKK
jgi:hypothetical protein